ncbi:MAG TPA: CdaR family protein [Candidatus Acidoferrales bacterium]|nr:CdaR family protein [Candidatus Acidoferrales bacterium]
MIHALKRFAATIFENPGWKLLSLAAAVVIWALVASEPEVATFTPVRLEFNHLPENLDISSEPVGSVVLELKGPSGELRGFGDGVRPEVVVDTGGAGPGLHTFTIGEGNVRLARGVRLVRAIPSEVRLQFDTHLERTVPVQVRWAGEAPARYRVVPAVIGVQGPRSRVQRIAAVITDPVDISKVHNTSEIKVNVSVDDPYVRFSGPAEVMVEVAGK